MSEKDLNDKRISLAPLEFEEALEALLKTGPHPKVDEPAPVEGNEKAPPKGRRKRRAIPERRESS